MVGHFGEQFQRDLIIRLIYIDLNNKMIRIIFTIIIFGIGCKIQQTSSTSDVYVNFEINQISNTYKPFTRFSGGLDSINNIAIVVKLTNVSTHEICIEYRDKNYLRNIYRPVDHLGGNCGHHSPRDINEITPISLCIKPNEFRSDTIFYPDCYSYKDSLTIKYYGGFSLPNSRKLKCNLTSNRIKVQ